MKELVIKIDEEVYDYMMGETYDEHLDSRFDFKIRFSVKHGTLLDTLIAEIEQARDKDKLCEYPYNRCIDILKKEFHTYNSNEHLHTYKFTYIHGLDNSYRKVEFQAKNEKEAKETFYKKVGENFEHRILYITQDDNMIYEFC